MTLFASLRSALTSQGACAVGPFFDAERTALLSSEAAACFERAEPMVLTEYQLGVGGQQMRSPVRLAVAEGDRLRETHESEQMVTLASELAGAPMQPSHAAYLYYRTGDFIGLHLDLPACELTFLAGVDADAPPLVVHPELRGRSPEELLELARATSGVPEGGVPPPVAPGELIALDGGVAPHHTPRHRPAGRVSALASLCYVACAPLPSASDAANGGRIDS